MAEYRFLPLETAVSAYLFFFWRNCPLGYRIYTRHSQTDCLTLFIHAPQKGKSVASVTLQKYVMSASVTLSDSDKRLFMPFVSCLYALFSVRFIFAHIGGLRASILIFPCTCLVRYTSQNLALAL